MSRTSTKIPCVHYVVVKDIHGYARDVVEEYKLCTPDRMSNLEWWELYDTILGASKTKLFFPVSKSNIVRKYYNAWSSGDSIISVVDGDVARWYNSGKESVV